MSELSPCSGFANKPTFITVLWLKNDQDLYEYCRGRSAEDLRDFVLETIHESAEGMGADLIRWALVYVNWAEVEEALDDD